MSKSIYIVNPAADFPTYFGAEVVHGWGLGRASTIADLALPTLAAMVPPDFEVRLCDENISPVDFDCDPDFVAITGKVSQGIRMRAIAEEFRRRGTTVVIGGPFASLSPQAVAPYCDVLVQGEIEEIAAGLFADLRSGNYQAEYEGTRPDLDLTPVPRWDLYPNDRALLGSVQTSRGCPFQCEFCDVIQYLGRSQRHKSVANVVRELDQLYRLGYRSIFLADDNFTVIRSRARELLVALAAWNQGLGHGKVTFSTQLSIDIAQDDDMLRLCAEAGLIQAFIGIETPNEESLRESKKRQNIGVDLVQQIDKFYAHGIQVIAGMIVGFDHDRPDIFQRQYDFAMSASIPVVTLGALVAPAATPLHDRMAAEGRLLADGSEVAAMPWSTNIQPAGMTQDELLHGVQWLANKLYQPVAFTERLLRFVERLGERQDPKHRDLVNGSSGGHRSPAQRSVERDAQVIIGRLAKLGGEESKMAYALLGALSKKPQALDFIVPAVLQYAQIRYMYEQGQLWESYPAA